MNGCTGGVVYNIHILKVNVSVLYAPDVKGG